MAGAALSQDVAQSEVKAETKAALTPDQQVAQADAIQRSAAALAVRLAKMLDEARTDKDIMRANCVNRKLTEVNASARTVDQRATALKDARNGGDASRSNHEFTVLTVLAQKLNMLQNEANQCLGQSLYEPGASQVVTTIAPNTPVVDPTELTPTPTAPPVFTVPPPPASPTF